MTNADRAVTFLSRLEGEINPEGLPYIFNGNFSQATKHPTNRSKLSPQIFNKNKRAA